MLNMVLITPPRTGVIFVMRPCFHLGKKDPWTILELQRLRFRRVRLEPSLDTGYTAVSGSKAFRIVIRYDIIRYRMSHRYWANFSTCTRLCIQISEYERQKNILNT